MGVGSRAYLHVLQYPEWFETAFIATNERARPPQPKKSARCPAFPRKSGCGVACAKIFRQIYVLASSFRALSLNITALRSRVERPLIFARNRAAAWGVLVFSFRNALSRGVSWYFRTGVGRPHNFIALSRGASSQRARPPQQKKPRPASIAKNMCSAFATKNTRPWLGISTQVGLWRGTSSNFHAKSRSGIKRPPVFT